MEIFHSVTLDKDKCMGCTTCIRQCPTEAIRVRRGKATILRERCIDCGQCVKVCPHHAKKAVCDPFERIRDYECTVALPAPSLYGQFRNLRDVNLVLAGLLEIGFHRVYEVARAAEQMSAFAARGNHNNEALPVISSACPACVRLICQRFPKLIPNIAPEIAPVELAALAARAEAVRATGLKPEQIGVFFITPCPAKVTAAHLPMGLDAPLIDGAISMTEVYLRLLPALKKVKNPPMLQRAGLTGVGWASSGGESAVYPQDTCIAVNEIENVIRVLEEIEDGKLPELRFVELAACTQGCVGGCLTVENPFVSKMRVRQLLQSLPDSLESRLPVEQSGTPPVREKPLEYSPVDRLSDDISEAMVMRRKMADITERLPGLDCSSCGAPSCRAHAEDVVRGYAGEDDCIFFMREKMDSEQYLPPPFRREE